MYLLLNFLLSTCVVFCYELDDYIGGFAKIGQVPYVVWVNSHLAHSCTGAILEEEWVLSAAHCFYKSGEVAPAESFDIVAGIVDHSLKNADRTSMQRSTAKQLIIHPAYREGEIAAHDIALVKLQSPFKFNDNVNKISVSGDEWPDDDPVKCVAAGFGDFGLEESNTRLKLFKPYAKHGPSLCPCVSRLQSMRLVCLKPELDLGICVGDSGGALVCNKKVVGVAHVMTNKRNCSSDIECSKLETISYYMYVCPYLDWMRMSVSSVPPKPVSCKASPLPNSIISLSLFFAFVALICF